MNALEGRWRSSIRDLQEKEAYLDQQVRSLSADYAGLSDIDLSLDLINTRLTIAIRLIDMMASSRDQAVVEEMGEVARREAVSGVQLLEELATANVSLDQKELILEAEGYAEARELFKQLLLQGGGAFFDTRVEDGRQANLVAETIAAAIAKFVRPDGNYAPVFHTERLPTILRRLLNVFFPVLAAENQAEPPYGIEEGEQQIYSAKRIKMPLSQAIHYYESELLPDLEADLQASPGDPDLQREIDRIERLVGEYKQLRFVPRSTPIIMTQDFYTESISQYTTEGELVVAVELPVTFNSGTNLERLQELVEADVTRRLAGKGLCEELDEQYRHLKSLESGIRGSSRLPSFKLDIAGGFGALKRKFPVMRYIENKTDFTRLVTMVGEGRRKDALAFLIRSGLPLEAHFKELL